MTPEPRVVELRIADMEPVKSFMADVGEALGILSAVSDSELASCPNAVAIAVASLRAAVARLGGDAPRTAEPRGDVIIEWPSRRAGSVVFGQLMAAYEVDPLGKPRPLYATRITIYAVPEGIVAAEVTALVDEDGQPIAEGAFPVVNDGKPAVRTFWYEVAEMRTRQAPQ